MDGMDMSMASEATPWNQNLFYSNIVAGILAGFLCLLTLRHGLLSLHDFRIHHVQQPNNNYSRIIERYNHYERYIVNKCSYTLLPSLPIFFPVGAFLIIILLVSAGLPLLLMNTDLVLNSNRAGFLALALVPFILGSAGKNSALVLLTGLSSAKLNIMHRILGTAVVVLTTVHMSLHIKSWVNFPVFLAMELALPKVHYGLAGYSCLLVVFIGSLYPVRRYAYEMFLFTHLFAFGFIGVIAKHTPYAMRYFATGLIVYFLNACAGWFVKSHLARSYTKVISPQCVRLSLRLASPMLHKSGDAVSLCIPSLSIFQWHPFTITSTNPEGTATDKLEVYVTVCGHWTRKLVQKADTSQELTVFVSGPFGDASSHLQAKTMLSTHDSIVIISGGAGITFGIRLLRELTAMFMDTPETQWKPMIKTNTIHFVWSVRSTDDLWFRTEIERILSFYENAHHKDPDYFPSLQVSLHVTRSSSALESSGNIDETFFTKQEKGFQQDVSEAYELEEQDTVGSCCRATDSITIKYSRFDLRLLSEMHSDQLGVYACGPIIMTSAIKNTIASSTCWKNPPFLHCEQFEI